MLTVDRDNIPDGLKSFDRWICWKWQWNEKLKKWDKPPYNPRDGKRASINDPKNWLTFERALAAQHQHGRYGLGFVLGEGDGGLHFSGIDLDDCRNRETGELSDLAKDIVAKMDTYCEVSPSGTGIKLLLIGSLPPKHRTENNDATVEIYTRGRYFTVTGQRVNGTPRRIDNRQKQLQEVWQKYIGNEKPNLKQRAPQVHAEVHAECLKEILTFTKNMEDSNDGSKRLYIAAIRVVAFNLSDAQAIATLRAYETKKPFPKAWTDQEILQRVRDVEDGDIVKRGSGVVIRNYEEFEDEDAEQEEPKKGEKASKKCVPLMMGDILEEIDELRDRWPRRVDNTLFVDDEHGLSWFDRHKAPGLFGWLQRHHPVDWKRGASYVSQTELFAEMERTAHRYDAIELLPHEPPIEGIYYRGTTPPPGDGSHLRWVLDRFRPETTIDYDLIKAAFMTALWGGPAGCRPAFVISSDHGRGVGKSKVAQIIGDLCGGIIDVSAGEDISQLKTRFLTPEARTKRIALIDNIKTMKLSWAELEALITSQVISGRQLYVGEGQRPNLITWFLTLNGVSLATDMAQRSVIIKVVKGENIGTWLEETRAYIEKHRSQIIGDIIAALSAEPFPLAQYSRWATWEQHVLRRLPEPGEAQRVILERQGEANCELDEAEIIEGYFADQLEKRGYCSQTVQVRIPVSIVAEWYNSATNDRAKTQAVSRHLNQMATEGQLKRLESDPSRTHGRCFIWTGSKADVVNEHICNDLQDRLEQNH